MKLKKKKKRKKKGILETEGKKEHIHEKKKTNKHHWKKKAGGKAMSKNMKQNEEEKIAEITVPPTCEFWVGTSQLLGEGQCIAWLNEKQLASCYFTCDEHPICDTWSYARDMLWFEISISQSGYPVTAFFYHFNCMTCTKEYLIQPHMDLDGTKYSLF